LHGHVLDSVPASPLKGKMLKVPGYFQERPFSYTINREGSVLAIQLRGTGEGNLADFGHATIPTSVPEVINWAGKSEWHPIAKVDVSALSA
jgi:hypothetical protein